MVSNIFDSHIHIDTHSSYEYELMAITGVNKILVPCSFTGEKRLHHSSFLQYFEKLIHFECARAEKFGIECYIALAVNNHDIGNRDEAIKAISILPDYFDFDCVCAIGEVSLKKGSDDEVELLKIHAQLANKFNLPLMISLPYDASAEITESLLNLLLYIERNNNFDRHNWILTDISINQFQQAEHFEFGLYNIAVAPVYDAPFCSTAKVNEHNCYELLQLPSTNYNKLAFCSGLHFGNADPNSLAKIAYRLKQKGIDQHRIDAVFFNNAMRFYQLND